MFCRLGGVELCSLGERLDQHGEGDGGVDARWAGAGLERDACVRLGIGEVADAQMNQGAVAREPEHVRERAEPAGVGHRFVEPRQRLLVAFGERESIAGVVEERGPVDRLRQQFRRSVERAEARGARPSPPARSPLRSRDRHRAEHARGNVGFFLGQPRAAWAIRPAACPRCRRRIAPRRARRPSSIIAARRSMPPRRAARPVEHLQRLAIAARRSGACGPARA